MAKSYRAKRHDVVRKKQRENDDSVHHPTEKIEQIHKTLKGHTNLQIIEFFAGEGNLTEAYRKYGSIKRLDKKLGTGDSYKVFHRLIAIGKTFDVIDLDPYGFPNRFFPDIFLLIDEGFIFITIPKPFINILNGITQQHLICYYGESNPNITTIIKKIKLYGLCHWRDLKLVDCIDLGRLWRLCFKVKKVKATEYCGVCNK